MKAGWDLYPTQLLSFLGFYFNDNGNQIKMKNGSLIRVNPHPSPSNEFLEDVYNTFNAEAFDARVGPVNPLDEADFNIQKGTVGMIIDADNSDYPAVLFGEKILYIHWKDLELVK